MAERDKRHIKRITIVTNSCKIPLNICGTIIETDLDEFVSDLMEDKQDLMNKIEEAEKGPQMMRRTKKAEDWLSRVQKAKTEADNLKKQVSVEIDEVHRRKLGSKRHKSSNLKNKVDNFRKLVKTLREEKPGSDEVVEEIIPKDKADDTLCIVESSTVVGTQSMFDQVWKCVDGKDVGIVGLYGMGGVGKTTLLKQINKNLRDTRKDCVEVIWVSVSYDEELSLERIQEQIGKQIDLFKETSEIKNDAEKETAGSSFFDDTWKNKSVEEKASKIFNSLSQKKFVLLLDDVWEMIDLEQVGVPFPPDPEKGSKIVFTTRSLEVCSLMEAEAEFKVERLPYAEAWELFRSTVGDKALDSQPEVREIAKAIVRECHGLPLALVTIGRAMVFKEAAEEWKDELQGLKRWTSSSSGWGAEHRRGILSTLKLSYDRLENDMFKSCFMYCILFPSDYKIHKRDLIDYWIGEGLLTERVGAPKQGYNVIDVLLDVCLLEEEEEDYVKIHCLILEMILWITSEFEKKGNFFIRTDAGLTEAPEIEKWKDMTRVSVMNNEIKNLAKCPHCPHLQTLFLNSNQLEKIDHSAYQCMPSLKVLNLSDNYSLIELPSEISRLTSLQHLDLSRTGIRELPVELKRLVNLKCLNLEHTYELYMIPRQMISNFSKLHVLRLLSCGSSTVATEDSVLYNDGEFLMEELLCLKHLNMLSITLKNFQALQKYLSSHKLQLCTQSLELQSIQHTKSLKVALSYLNHLKTLWISNCKDLEELKIDFGGEVHNIRESRSFPFLEEVIVEWCSNLKDLTWLILAPNLKHLTIKDCLRMEEVINVGKLSEFPETMANLVPFSKLKVLGLDNLPNLRSIYWTALPLADLRKQPEIRGCEQLQMFDKDKLKESVEEESEYTATKKPVLDPSSSSSSLWEKSGKQADI